MKTGSALLLPLLFACTAQQPDTDVPTPPDPLATSWNTARGLVGEWQNTMDSGDTLSYEHWAETDSAAMTGKGFVLVSSDTVFIEDLELRRRANGITYSARISSQNKGERVEFQLQTTGADTLLFTNPAHDFPTRLRYVRAADGAWDVLVGEGERSFPLKYVPRTP